MKRVPFFCLLIVVTVFTNCTNNTEASTDPSNETNSNNVATLNYSVVATYPHDTASFTQGLEFYKGRLLEGTGMEGHSKLLQVDLKTGKANKQLSIDSNLFG